MRILLIGEYSRFHNSLKEGLQELGHDVFIVSNSDFRKFPVDFSTDSKFCNTKFINIFRQSIFRLFSFDIATLEIGLRFYLLLNNFKNFDIVQLISENPIKTTKKIELFLLKKIFNKNSKIFLLSCGADFLNMKYDLEHKNKKSILWPFFKDPNLIKEYASYFDLLKENHKKIHEFVLTNCNGIIATDFDYTEATKNNPKYLGLIPYPINFNKINFEKLEIKDKIILFLGANKFNYHQKGIPYFEKALTIIKEKYNSKVELIIAENIPYNQYITLYDKAHILLDQVYAYDQGYNALEAMAKGKVVFTGAEQEFSDYYKLSERVCVNAKPDVDYLVNELSLLIENPDEIIAMGKRARAFIEKEHHYIKIAEKYLKVWH
ncbi:MAG: glycosyltransferase family 4 protein [Flavobacterium sp.]|nr:glycosyltransferase family 4 protein [Flavobacterium sp.]